MNWLTIWVFLKGLFQNGKREFPIVKDTTPDRTTPRLYIIRYNKTQGQQLLSVCLYEFAVSREKMCNQGYILSAVTFRGHLPVMLSAKSKGSEDMKQILIVEDDSFLNKMLAYNLTCLLYTSDAADE